MDWYYSYKKEQRGPITDEEFLHLIDQGIIKGKSLVWFEGLEEWTPLENVSILLDYLQKGGAIQNRAIRCPECGHLTDIIDLTNAGAQWTCHECEAHYTSQTTLSYASFWLRTAAKFIDFILLYMLSAVSGGILLAIIGGVVYHDGNLQSYDAGRFLVFYYVLTILMYLGIPLLYETFFIGKFAATPGKMIFKIIVIAADNRELNYKKAFVRATAEILSVCLLCIGYFIAGFDAERRTLHDRLAKTRVVGK